MKIQRQHHGAWRERWFGLTMLCVITWGCEPTRHEQDVREVVTTTATPDPPSSPTSQAPSAMIPFEGDVFSPSLARLASNESFSGEHFAQQEKCAECHAGIAAEWGESMHAFASLSNAIYLESFKDFAKEKGEKNTRFCAGCHDPAMLFDVNVELGAARTDIAQAHQGVSCRSCHGVVEVEAQGNASYTISTKPLFMPDVDDAKSVAKHRAQVTTSTLDANALCASCHRGVLTPTMGHDIVLPGLDELGPWRRSAFAGNQTWRIDAESLPREDCVSCHMPKKESSSDTYSSHRFAGGHSTFAAMIGASEQLAAIEENLQKAATLDIFPLDHVPASAFAAGASQDNEGDASGVLGFDVVIFNERVGHAFPGGAKDLRDTWLEVIVKDASGKVLATSGVEHEETASEPYTYVLHARLADASGDRQATHDVSHFRTPVYDHTIKPRDAAVVRYLFKVDSKAAKNLSISARLRHRRLTPHILERACNFSKSEQGGLYGEEILANRGKKPDPCIKQPVLDVDTMASTWKVELESTSGALKLVRVGDEARGEEVWQRWYRYGLGLLHHVQESLDEATQAFNTAESLASELGARQKAMTLQGLGMVAARQGRTKDAMDFFERSDALLTTPHPSNAYHSGLANMRVWKFEEASEAFERAAKLGSAKDARVLRQWAMALGSKSRYAEALDVAQRGLLTEPRDPHLLRSQMLSLRHLEAASAETRDEAERAYDVYKRDTAAPHVRDACSKKDPVCRAERVPIGVRWLRQPEKR